jgi:hypothetical protein
VIIDTGASVTIVRLDITAAPPERELTWPYVSQMVPGKEGLVELTLGQCPLTTWVFVTKITDEIILGLDDLCAHNASMILHVRCNWVKKYHCDPPEYDYIHHST